MKNSLLNHPAVWAGLLGMLVLIPGFKASAQTAAVLRSRTFVLTSTATVPVPPAGTKTLDLWLPVPHSDASQDVAQLKIEGFGAGRRHRHGSCTGEHERAATQHGRRLGRDLKTGYQYRHTQ